MEQGQRQRQGCRWELGCAGTIGVPVAGPARPLQCLEGDGCLMGSHALQGPLHLRWGDRVSSRSEGPGEARGLLSHCTSTCYPEPRMSPCPPSSPALRAPLPPHVPVHPQVLYVLMSCLSLPSPCPVPPRALLTSSTFLKTRSRFSARAALTSASVQFLASSSATSAGYVETSSRPVGSLRQPAARSRAGGSRDRRHPPTAPPAARAGHRRDPHHHGKLPQLGKCCPIPPACLSPALPCDAVVVPAEADGLGTSHFLHVVHMVCGYGGAGVSGAVGGHCHPPIHPGICLTCDVGQRGCVTARHVRVVEVDHHQAARGGLGERWPQGEFRL